MRERERDTFFTNSESIQVIDNASLCYLFAR